MEITEEITQAIQGLSMAVLKKDASSLTKEEASFLIYADIMSLPQELVVTTNDTRKTEVQYCTNSYGGSLKISLQSITGNIKEQIDAIENPVESLNQYIKLKEIFIKFIQFKYNSMESILREQSREAQKKDKIVPVGRYND